MCAFFFPPFFRFCCLLCDNKQKPFDWDEPFFFPTWIVYMRFESFFPKTSVAFFPIRRCKSLIVILIFFSVHFMSNFKQKPKKNCCTFALNLIVFLYFYLQCLEQEKHILRRKLSEAESERDLRVQELESDYSDLKSKLMSQVI